MSDESHRRIFGVDLAVAARAPGFDLVAQGDGDLALSAGDANIVQALTLRLSVRRGELARLGWPDYGSRLHELIGEPNNARTHLKLMAFARAAVEADPRVREVVAARVEQTPGDRDSVRLVLDVALIDGPAPLNLVFDVNLEAL